MAARDGVVGRVAPVTAASLFVSPVKTDSPVSAETENGEAGFSFERNQFRGFNREANPFFCRAASLSAVAGVETGAGFTTADFGAVVLDDAGSEPRAASRAGLIGSSSVRRTTSIFGVGAGAGGLSLLAGGGEPAAAARVGGGEVAAFSRGGGEAGDD